VRDCWDYAGWHNDPPVFVCAYAMIRRFLCSCSFLQFYNVMNRCSAFFLYLIQSILQPISNFIACFLIGYDVGTNHIVAPVFAAACQRVYMVNIPTAIYFRAVAPLVIVWITIRISVHKPAIKILRICCVSVMRLPELHRQYPCYCHVITSFRLENKKIPCTGCVQGTQTSLNLFRFTHIFDKWAWLSHSSHMV